MPDELPEGHIQMGGKWQHMALPGEEAPAPRGRGRRGEPAVTEEPAAEEEEAADPDYYEDEDDQTS